MYKEIVVVMPALNEEKAIAHVLADIPKENVAVVVVDNGSTDNTMHIAQLAGAVCLHEPEAGYGRACLCGLDYIAKQSFLPKVVVFLDADYSDFPTELPLIVQPILEEEAELVVGSRVLGNCEKGALTPPQRWGNALATYCLRHFYHAEATDLGPFRAIRYDSLLSLKMEDRTYGWNVEMHIKAAKQGLRYLEVPVSYRKRIGHSKISGTLSGVCKAGYKIINTLLKYR